MRKTDTTYFQEFDFEFVTSIRTVTTTPAGGFLVNAKTGVSFGDNYSINPPEAQLAKDHIYGDIDGQAGEILQTEDPSALINIGGTSYARVQFSNQIGYNASNGNLVYGADIDLIPNDPVSAANRLDAIFIGNSPAIVQGDALPTGSGFGGAAANRLNFVGSAGDNAFYKASYIATGITDGAGLFNTDGDVLLYTGQSLGPSGAAVQDKDFSLGNTSISNNGQFYIIDADVGVGSSQGALVINGQVAQTPTGTFLREGDLVEAGGTERFDNFNQVAINDSGKWAASGWTDAASNEDSIFIDGEIAFREGDVLPKVGGGVGAALTGLPQYVDVNAQGDVAFFFGGSGTGAIVLNGEVVVEVGDSIGSDTFTKFAVSPLALSDRQSGGSVNLYFEAADTGGFDSNSFGVYHIALSIPLTPGDTDGDGDIDDSDLGTSFANYTGPVGAAGNKLASQGDTDGDGDVDDSDLGTSFAAYTGPLAPASVPEPATALFFVLGLIAYPRPRRS